MAKPEWWDKIKKPNYAVPSMAEIAAVPKNGYTAVSTFSGCGGSSLGYKMAGFDVRWASEFIPAAQDTYRVNHRDTYLDTRDIRQVQPLEVLLQVGLGHGELDVFDGSPPCFIAKTPVLTQRGIIPIEQVQVGDKVFTHQLRWRKVLRIGHKHARTIIIDDHIGVTPDHLFYSRENLLARGIMMGEPGWHAAEHTTGMFCATPITFPSQQAPVCPRGLTYDEVFWYVVGRWIGDGWLRIQKSKNPNHVGRGKAAHHQPVPCLMCQQPSYQIQDGTSRGRYSSYCSVRCRTRYKVRLGKPRWAVMLCCGHKEADDLRSKLSMLGVIVGETKMAATYRFIIARKPFVEWLLKHFGRGAEHKTLPFWALTMKQEWRSSLFNGYIDADGSRQANGRLISGTISPCLRAGMILLAGTLDYTTCTIKRKMHNDIICGRTVNTHQSYSTGYWPDDGRYTRVEGGIRWRKMRRDVQLGSEHEAVYDIEVEEDHSFLADTFFVHNCASFSTAGKRADGWGDVRKYSDTHQRVDDLFFEYTRLVRGIQPKVFIAENVSGLVKGVAKGYFVSILKELKDCGYRVEARLIDAQWLGVPQSRQRLIFMGVRNDLKVAPKFPTPLRYRYSVREAIPWLADLRFTPHGPNSFAVPEDPMNRPAPTVLAQAEGGTWARHDTEVYEAPIEGRAIEDTGGEWGMGDVTDRPAPTVRAGGVGHLIIEADSDISRFAIGEEWNKLKPGEQSDKYFQLVKQDPDMPCQTVTASGGSASLASVTHPYARRKFSLAELKRISGFPDDFILTGTYEQSWERIGRAVPPVMMGKIALAAMDILDKVHGITR